MARGDELARATPEDVGMSAVRLARAAKEVEELVAKREFAGVVTVVARNGKVVQCQAVGMMDLETAKPMTTNTIFRIYSMTKPITTVAAMMLWEEGKFGLDEPVCKYIPQLKGLRVYAVKGETVASQREISLRDLMRHTSGLIDAFGDSPVDRMYRDKNLLDPNSTQQDLVTKLTTLPLQDQPGTRFHYSVSTDVLGRLVEVISGKSLDVYLEQRIFKPLDMVDTGFYIPASKADRFATNYGPAGRGRLKVIDDPTKSVFLIPPKFLSGGGGLVSTARDYTRFCQMLLDGGKLQGVRLLKPETIQLMTHNQLPPEALPLTVTTSKGDKGLGFGLGFAVRMAPNPDDTKAVIGEYHWGGAASTAFAVCPSNQTVLVVLAQHIPFKAKLIDTFKRAVNAAVEPDSIRR